MNRPSDSPSRVIFCRGARQTEERLVDEIERLVCERIEGMVEPVRVVVPSRSLRRHVVRVLARRRGAVAGLQVQTLFGLALDVLARSGLEPPRADAGFEVQVRRLAAADPMLRRSLEGLTDGYDAVGGAVRDLLDAGFLPGNEDGVLERLEDVAGEVASERLERSAALVRLASAAFADGEELGLRRSMRALQMAEEALQIAGPDLLPTKAVVVHGFADVTGIAADLLVALVRVLGGTVLLDRPPDPAAPERDDLGGAYLTRLEERMIHLARETDERTDPSPVIEFAEAPDAESEARWVAERIRGLLDDGVHPEDVAVVGRAVETMARPLRRHFRRLGVPFSGAGTRIPGAGPRRRLRRLTEVLRRGSKTEVDRWIEARAADSGSTELLLGLRVLGFSQLDDLAHMAHDVVPAAGVRLPVAMVMDDDPDDGEHASRRLENDLLFGAVEEAGRLVSLLERRPKTASAAVHRRHTSEVVSALGWVDEAPETRAIDAALGGLCRQLPPRYELTHGEWLKLVGESLEGVGEIPLGGDGAGVQVLTVMEARAMTSRQLFVVGVNRGVFPRVGHEDPMLPEAVRSRLAADVLPEMPVKGRSADEERYLFAQLLSSAPSVSLSWHVFGSDGTVTPSPFVDRLRDRVATTASVAQLWATGDSDMRPRPAYELAVLNASSAGASNIDGLLQAALAEGRSQLAGDSPLRPVEAVASARADVLKAVERPVQAASPAPWFGFSGARDDGDLWVTHAEGMGTCPWRAFVQRRLEVQPMPDPLIGLPRIDGLLVGKVVHGVLDSLVRESVGSFGELHEVLSRDPVKIRWPDSRRLDELAAREAARVAKWEGLEPMGMAPLLAARALQFLAVEHNLEWGDGVLEGVRGSEVEGLADVAGVAQPLLFRADRVDAAGVTTVLVDYKAAKPAVTAANDPHRTRNLRLQVARGRLLQAAAYSRARGLGKGLGKYLYLKPHDEWSDAIREIAISGEDREEIELFETAVRTISSARERGIAFPRVEEADGRPGKHCEHCSVAEACRRDDSAFRRDLVRFMNAEREADDDVADAAFSLWWLGSQRPEAGA